MNTDFEVKANNVMPNNEGQNTVQAAEMPVESVNNTMGVIPSPVAENAAQGENNEAQAQIEPLYTFKTLDSTDLFPVMRIVRKIGVNKFKDIFATKTDENGEVDGLAFMLDIVQIVLDGVTDCEEEIFTLLARVSNLSKEEIKQLDLATFTTMIMDFFKKDELKDFLRAVFTALGAIQN